MPLWGTEDTLEGKPKIHGRSFLAAVQAPGVVDPRTGIYATTAGWTQKAADGVSEEVLVAIRGLSTRATAEGDTWTTAAMAQANITSFNWNISTFDKSAGGTLSVTANFNETVTVTGSPTLTVVNDNRANHTLVYNAGSTTNRLTFILAIPAANAATNAADELSVGANAIAQVGGSTIVDTVGGGNSVITNSAGIGTATGIITVVA